MAIQDGVGALITYLQAQSDISSLLSTRVFGQEVPKEQASGQPRKAIVIADAGGIRAADYSDINNMRLDFFCYGETTYQAKLVWRTLVPILTALERNVTDSTILFNAIHSAGPFPQRSAQVEWPLIIDTWLIKMEETVVV